MVDKFDEHPTKGFTKADSGTSSHVGTANFERSQPYTEVSVSDLLQIARSPNWKEKLTIEEKRIVAKKAVLVMDLRIDVSSIPDTEDGRKYLEYLIAKYRLSISKK